MFEILAVLKVLAFVVVLTVAVDRILYKIHLNEMKKKNAVAFKIKQRDVEIPLIKQENIQYSCIEKKTGVEIKPFRISGKHGAKKPKYKCYNRKQVRDFKEAFLNENAY